MIVIKEPSEAELKEMYQLRWKINRKPFGLPKGTEVDDKESLSFKVIAFDDKTKKIVGSARLTINSNNVGEVNFVGVDESYRSQGIGKKIMEYLHQKAKSFDLIKIELAARKTAENFYHQLGYISIKEYFLGSPYNVKEIQMQLILK